MKEDILKKVDKIISEMDSTVECIIIKKEKNTIDVLIVVENQENKKLVSGMKKVANSIADILYNYNIKAREIRLFPYHSLALILDDDNRKKLAVDRKTMFSEVIDFTKKHF